MYKGLDKNSNFTPCNMKARLAQLYMFTALVVVMLGKTFFPKRFLKENRELKM